VATSAGLGQVPATRNIAGGVGRSLIATHTMGVQR
jgi:hypothetical protein